MEQGIPRHGVDMGPDNLPGEAGIVERAVSFTKGCYVGQEPVARMYHRGRPNRHLRGLRLDAPLAAGEPLFAGEREVGRLTSAVESPAPGSRSGSGSCAGRWSPATASRPAQEGSAPRSSSFRSITPKAVDSALGSWAQNFAWAPRL